MPGQLLLPRKGYYRPRVDIDIPGAYSLAALPLARYPARAVRADGQILAILLLESIVTLRGFGFAMGTIKTPLNELITNGSPSSSSRGVGAHAENVLGAPTGMTGVSGPQVVHRV
jgi:hypothetical protein